MKSVDILWYSVSTIHVPYVLLIMNMEMTVAILHIAFPFYAIFLFDVFACLLLTFFCYILLMFGLESQLLYCQFIL